MKYLTVIVIGIRFTQLLQRLYLLGFFILLNIVGIFSSLFLYKCYNRSLIQVPSQNLEILINVYIY